MSKYHFFLDDCSMGIEWNVIIFPDGDEYKYFISENQHCNEEPYKFEEFSYIKKGPFTNEFIGEKIVCVKNFVPRLNLYDEEEHKWIIDRCNE